MSFSHWLVDFLEGLWRNPFNNKVCLMIDGTPNRALHFYPKDIIGSKPLLFDDYKGLYMIILPKILGIIIYYNNPIGESLSFRSRSWKNNTPLDSALQALHLVPESSALLSESAVKFHDFVQWWSSCIYIYMVTMCMYVYHYIVYVYIYIYTYIYYISPEYLVMQWRNVEK